MLSTKRLLRIVPWLLLSVVYLSGQSWIQTREKLVPACLTYTVNYTAFDFVVPDTTVDITLFVLPARAKILGVNIKHSVAWAGAGITAVTVSVGDGSGTADQYASAFDIFQAVTNTAFQDSSQFKSTTMAASGVVAHFIADANFGNGGATNLTAGSVAVPVCWVTLP